MTGPSTSSTATRRLLVGVFALAVATGAAAVPAVAAGSATSPPAVSRGALRMLDVNAASGLPADAAPEGHVLVSPDQRWVAFVSTATNLLPGAALPSGTARWFAVNVVTTKVVLLASPAHGSTSGDPSGMTVARFSPDSRSVLLNVTPQGASGGDVYLEDIATGAMTLVSSGADGTRVDGDNGTGTETGQGHTMTAQAFSANGRYVSFSAQPLEGPIATFRKDLVTGALDRASISPDGVVARVLGAGVALSPDGRKAVFDAYDIPHAGRQRQTGVKNFVTGVLKPVSRTQANVPAGGVFGNAEFFSPDGNTVYFTALRVPGVASTFSQVYAKDLTTGTLTLLSAAPDGSPANALAGSYVGGNYGILELSPDGTSLIFDSPATNLVPVPAGRPARDQLFLKNLTTGALTLLSTTSSGTPLTASSTSGSTTTAMTRDAGFSPDGQWVWFRAESDTFTPHPWPGVATTYAKNLATGELVVTSATEVGHVRPTDGANGAVGVGSFVGSDQVVLVMDGHLYLKDLS